MKKLKLFIDNLANDKKSHVVLGEIVNPIIILITIISLNFINYSNSVYKCYFDVVISILFCILAHSGIELWQRYTKIGKAEFWDAAAGSYSAVTKGILLIVILLLKNN